MHNIRIHAMLSLMLFLVVRRVETWFSLSVARIPTQFRNIFRDIVRVFDSFFKMESIHGEYCYQWFAYKLTWQRAKLIV